MRDSLEHRQRSARSREPRPARNSPPNSEGIVRSEDATRPVTSAYDHISSGYNDMRKGVDVFGYNYKPFEYGKFRAANPAQPLLGSETASCISSRGEYFFPVSDNQAGGKADFQMSSYDLYAPPWATTPDAEFRGQDKNPFVAGEFVWTGFDYLGEPTPYNGDMSTLPNLTDPALKARLKQELDELGKIKVPSRSSYFGIIDLAGFPKDRYYLYQARWRPDSPDGARPAALDLARPRRANHAGPRLHLGRRGGIVPERKVAWPEEKGPV